MEDRGLDTGSGNLYVHFPFCRRKCAYCALYSRAGVAPTDRDAYAGRLAAEIAGGESGGVGTLATVYFGGGSPALCGLEPVFAALRPRLRTSTEFTVELHPADVTAELLGALRAGGVNRISMGVQSFDDATLAAMGRGYTVDAALHAFESVKRVFDNAGIDLIVGFPGDPGPLRSIGTLRRFTDLGMRHCSVYALQNERGLNGVPDDDVVLDEIRDFAAALKDSGLERYEISNYAAPGFECRHNLAVWRGEDYVGIGEGACGRVGRTRTRGLRGGGYATETLAAAEDLKERTIFRLRTRDGLDTARFPEWRPALERFTADGLLTRVADASDSLAADGRVYRLTPRGAEVCDAILAEIV